MTYHILALQLWLELVNFCLPHQPYHRKPSFFCAIIILFRLGGGSRFAAYHFVVSCPSLSPTVFAYIERQGDRILVLLPAATMADLGLIFKTPVASIYTSQSVSNDQSQGMTLKKDSLCIR